MANDIDALMDLEAKQKAEWLIASAIPVGECLYCHLSTDKDGYAQVGFKYKNIRAHRFIHEHLIGPINGLYVLHTCDNPPCINPKHLFLGTAQDNMDDLIAKGRRQKDNKGTRALTDAQIKEAVRLYESGWTQRELAETYKVNQSTISLSLRYYREQQNG